MDSVQINDIVISKCMVGEYPAGTYGLVYDIDTNEVVTFIPIGSNAKLRVHLNYVYKVSAEVLDKIKKLRMVPIKEHDEINHPKHYNSHPSKIECIEVTRHMSFNDGNVIKYLWRAGLKDSPTDKDSLIQSIKDHKKALWYLSDEIKELERKLDEFK